MATIGIVAAGMMGLAFASVISAFDIICFAIVLAVFLFLASRIFRFLERRGWHVAVPVLAFLAGIFLFHNLYLFVISLPPGSAVRVLTVLAVPSAVATGVIWALRGRMGGGKLALVAVVLGLLVSAYPAVMAQGENAQSQGVRQTSLAENAVDPAYNVTKYIRPVTFRTKPNVYLLGLSAGTAEAMVQAHLGIESSPLSDYLRTSGFRIFHNVFTEAQLTRLSYDLILSMNRDLFFSLNAKDRGTMISGNIPSPLYTIFHDNGYEVSTLAEAAKFGVKGPYVERYEVAVEASLCNFHFLPEEVKSTMFLGGCDLRKLFNPLSKKKNKSIFDFQIEQLARIGQSDKPQLVFLHMRPPYHYRDMKLTAPDPAKVQPFAEKSKEFLAQAAENLRRVQEEIYKDDPNAIILAFGDHGLSLSDPPPDGSLTEFFVHDRYAVLGAVYPAGACADYFPKAGAYAHVTSAELVGDLVRCLSGGQDPYPVGYQHLGIFNQSTFDFAGYEYEPAEPAP
ncbi:hypothetical protein [Paragemmobacter straminiformis]|nr:hypothetical protein [Gemmobacter straminiformis]